MTSINNQIFIDIFNRLEEELETSQIILMKQNNLENLLPIHCYMLLTIDSFEKSPIIVQIAQKLYKSKAAVGAVIKTLEKKGYTKAINEQPDKRTKKIILTQKGRQILQIINNMWTQHNLVALKNLNNQERKNLYQILNKIEKNINSFNDLHKIKI